VKSQLFKDYYFIKSRIKLKLCGFNVV